MQIQYRPGILARFLAAGCVALGGVISLSAEEKEPSSSEIMSWTNSRVSEWQPTAAERRFDEIGWADSLTAARRLSVESGLPVFLFTMDGRIAIGRC